MAARKLENSGAILQGSRNLGRSFSQLREWWGCFSLPPSAPVFCSLLLLFEPDCSFGMNFVVCHAPFSFVDFRLFGSPYLRLDMKCHHIGNRRPVGPPSFRLDMKCHLFGNCRLFGSPSFRLLWGPIMLAIAGYFAVLQGCFAIHSMAPLPCTSWLFRRAPWLLCRAQWRISSAPWLFCRAHWWFAVLGLAWLISFDKSRPNLQAISCNFFKIKTYIKL